MANNNATTPARPAKDRRFQSDTNSMPEQERASALQCLVEDVYNAFVRTQSLIDLIAASNNVTGPALRECLLMAMEYCHELDDKIEEYGKLRERDAVAKPHQEQELSLTNAQAKTFLRMALDCLYENGEPKEDADIPALMTFAEGATYEASCWLPNFLRGEEVDPSEETEGDEPESPAETTDFPGKEHLLFIKEKMEQVEGVLWDVRSNGSGYEPSSAMFRLLNETIQAANKAVQMFEKATGSRCKHMDDLYVSVGYAAAFADVLAHHDWSLPTDVMSLRIMLEDFVVEAKAAAEKALAGEGR